MPQTKIEARRKARQPKPSSGTTLTNIEAWPNWNPHLKWAVLEGPLTEGSYLTLLAKKGRQTAYTIEEITEPTTLKFGIQFGPMASISTEYRLTPASAGSTVDATTTVAGPLRAIVLHFSKQKANRHPQRVGSSAGSRHQPKIALSFYRPNVRRRGRGWGAAAGDRSGRSSLCVEPRMREQKVGE